MEQLSKDRTDYIRDNINKKTVREIAKELGIEKRVVEKYVKKIKRETAAQSHAPKDKRINFVAYIFPKLSPKAQVFWQVIFIFVLALIVRLVYIKALHNTYFFAPFKGGYDDYMFDMWAQEILKGNWLGNPAIYIYRMPLYVYFLSLVYFVLGHSYWALYLLQSFIGALTCVIVYAIASLLFNRTVGLVAGAVNALYGIFLFYNGMVVGETLALFTTCSAFLFLSVFQKKEKLYYLFLSGIFIGLSALLRGNMLVVLPLLILWLATFFRKNRIIKIVSYVLILAAAVLLAISPIIVRNYVCEKDFVPISALGGLNLYIGNAFGADGKYRAIEGVGGNPEEMIAGSVRIAEKNVGRSLKPSEVSNYWMNQTLRSIKEHRGSYLMPLIAKKFMLFWNAYELPDIWDYYFFRQYVPVLQFPLFGFSVIAAFGLVGMYLGWARKRDLSLLYLFIVGYLASLLLFFITSRYRMQVVPFLAIFGAYAIVNIGTVFKEDKRRAMVCVIILIAALMFSHIPVRKVSFETSHNSLGILLKRDGRVKEAVEEYNKAIEIAPKYPTPYYNLGVLYVDMEEYDKALAYFKKTLELDPGFGAAREMIEKIKDQEGIE